MPLFAADIGDRAIFVVAPIRFSVDEAMEKVSGKGSCANGIFAHQDHPGDPEEEDVVAGDKVELG